MIELPSDLPVFVKNLTYGDPGVGKSEFVGTYVDYMLQKKLEMKPVKVWMFDPFGKDKPYLRRGNPSGYADLGDSTPARLVYGPDGQTLFEIEYFFDLNPAGLGKAGSPLSAYERFQASLRETDWSQFSAVCLDSLTGFRNAVLHVNQFKVNAVSKGGAQQDARQWYGAATRAIETDVMSTLAWAPCHTFVLAHVNAEHDEMAQGGWIYGIMAPGKLSTAIASVFSEVYWMYVQYGEKKQGNQRDPRYLLTQHNGRFIAQTHIDAPQICTPTWEAVTQNIRTGR